MGQKLELITKSESFVYGHRGLVPVIGVMLFVLVAVWGYSGEHVWFLGPPLGVFSGQDFRQILRASSEIVAGENPYQHALEFGRAPNFSEFMNWQASPYPYAPLPAVLARPLLAMSSDGALTLWTVVNWLLIVGCALAAVAAFNPSRSVRVRTSFIFMLVMFYLYRPVQLDLQLGNIDILMLFLLLLTYALYRRDRVSAALPLALAIALKPIVAPMLVFFVWKRQWRIALLGVAVAGLLTAYGFFVAGWHWLPDYLQVNLVWATTPMTAFPFNQSPMGFMQRLFTSNGYIVPLIDSPLLARGLTMLIGLLAIGAWLRSVSHDANRDDIRSMIGYSLTLTTITLVSPLFEDTHVVWLLMPLSALLLVTLGELQNRRGAWLLLGGLLIALYLGFPRLHEAIYYSWDSLEIRNTLIDSRYALLTGAYLYGLLALEVCLIWYLAKVGRRQHDVSRGALSKQGDFALRTNIDA